MDLGQCFGEWQVRETGVAAAAGCDGFDASPRPYRSLRQRLQDEGR